MKGIPKTGFYHAHVYFDGKSRQSAEIFRQGLIDTFPGRVRIHDLIDEPIGPHPLPMFEADVPASEIEAVKTWMSAHHGNHSILVHPLTGDDLADHRDFPEWIGPALKLDLDFLKRRRS